MDTANGNEKVALPGAGGAEPTILEVLNRNITSESIADLRSEKDSSSGNNKAQSGSSLDHNSQLITETDGVHRSTEDLENQHLSSSPIHVRDSDEEIRNVLEIESHLIETLENYSVSERSDSSGVTVEEVPPAQEELSKPSQIETETSPKTVIEVTPSLPKLHKPVESDVSGSCKESELSFAKNANAKEVDNFENKRNEILTPHIEDSQTDSTLEEEIDSGKKDCDVKEVQSKQTDLKINQNTDNLPKVAPSSQEENLQEKHNRSETPTKFEEVDEPSDNLNSQNDTVQDELKFLEDIKNTAEDVPSGLNLQKEEPVTESQQTEQIQKTEDQQENKDTAHPQSEAHESKPQTELNNNCEEPDHHTTPSDPDVSSQPLQLGINGLPVFITQSEEEAKRIFLDSIPPLTEADANSLSTTSRKEYYQSLREYLIKQEDRPPVPLQTYRWEDLKRAKLQGGYPWTHLYKRPLGPDEEPEIVLLLRKSQDLQHIPSESPKSLKKVRIHDQVLVKETERYISDLSDAENCHDDDSKSLESETASPSASESEEKRGRIQKLRGILKRSKPKRSKSDSSPKRDSEIETAKTVSSPKKSKCCPPIMDKLKIMADRQMKKRHIKKVPLNSNEKIILSEEQKILKLKLSPKAERSEIPHFVEKQDSDEILEILELEESPSKIRKHREELAEENIVSSVLVPDEIIEIPSSLPPVDSSKTEVITPPTPPVPIILEGESQSNPPFKAPRRRKEHVYEDIDNVGLGEKIDEILEEAFVESLKRSLASQDESAKKDVDVKPKLEEMGSSEEDQDKTLNRLAPISSIDSASSEDERRVQLSPVAEESDPGSQDDLLTDNEGKNDLKIVEDPSKEDQKECELKSVLKREPSPNSDKKVTFSHVEDEAEPHKEDIELPEHVKLPENRWSKISDHEYEPIGEPVELQPKPMPSPGKDVVQLSQPEFHVEVSAPMEVSDEIDTRLDSRLSEDQAGDPFAEELQRDIEERYFSSATTTPRTESRTDYEIHTSQVDSSALEELPLKPESRKKGFIASAQDRSRKMHDNLRSQAGKIRTKLRGMKKPASGSPKSKERKRFKAPEFSKIKLPEMKRPDLKKFKSPDMSKFKAPDFKKIEFKRPEFTKFSKPDMSKFKVPERLSFKLTRSRSLKEPATSMETTSGTTPESAGPPPKKKFDFNFSTYPRALRRKKDKIANEVVARAEDAPSSETPPSFESATIPRGARDKGPVGSRWADKFSDISYGDSESGKYQRYGSELESLERAEIDSSVERRMKGDLDQNTPDEAEITEIETVEQKQFAEYDEENRAIHEISKNREGEFKKRRPMVHQDSDLVSEESKDVGWTEKDILRNKILRGTEGDIEPGNYPSEEGLTGSVTNTNQETQSTGSSGALRQKGVLEEIDDDQFFLRKRGISQDNIEIRQYISSAIREGFDTPLNALAQLGDSQGIYPEDMDISNGQLHYGYDVPPPKPRRVKYKYDQNIDSAEISQEFDVEQKENYDDNLSLPQTDSDYFKNFTPNRPFRKPKKQYSEDSQDIPDSDLPYFDDDDDRLFYKKEQNNNFNLRDLEASFQDTERTLENVKDLEPPKAPKRRKKQARDSLEKDSYVNGFSGRSVSNTFLPEDHQMEELVVYRTEHEYIIPLAQAENFTTPTPPTRSRSRSRFTDDDRTSQGADSLMMDNQQEGEQFILDMKENDGYAVVRKEPPPRPPPPVRRKRSPNILDNKFSTMPHLKSEAPPERPKRNYSTIGPSRPPRRKSSMVVGDDSLKEKSSDITEYEELDEVDRPESPRNLVSGDVINKMKFRPLPPPPRPPRDHKKYKYEGKFDQDGGAEKIVFDIQQNGNYEIDKSVEKCIEVEVSTQTDPLPDDFVCEEFEITDDMKVIEPRRSKTLEDILKEEQEAEIERARQLAEEENLTRSIQRFRDAGQRSYSERSRGSTADRSRTQSRPNTPSAIVIEKRVPTPIPNRINETMLTASITVQPVDDFDLDDEIAREFRSEEKLEEMVKRSDISSQQQEEEVRLTVDYSSDHRSTSDQKPSDHETQDEEIDFTEQKEPIKQFAEDEDLMEVTGRSTAEPEDDEPPPRPPPRKRSSGSNIEPPNVLPEDQSVAEPTLSVASNQYLVSQGQIGRLALADLEVERLNVHALQAGRIMVSHLQGAQISADELECKSGNLTVRNLEFPPGFIEEIIERVRNVEREQSRIEPVRNENTTDTKPTQEEAPARPPLPQQTVFPPDFSQYSVPPAAFYQLRNPTDEEHSPNVPVHRRRRHHRRRDSSSDEDYYREHRRSRQGTLSPEPSIGQVGGQLLRLCGSSVLRTMNQIVNYLQSVQKDGNDRNISTAIVLLVLMAFGFLLLGLSGKNIHHHHWDFFNPPGNQGRS